jgi:hypothetical protein
VQSGRAPRVGQLTAEEIDGPQLLASIERAATTKRPPPAWHRTIVSPPAEISEEVKRPCTLPEWEHPAARTRTALHSTRTSILDDGRNDEIHAELSVDFSPAEIVELVAFFCLTRGGARKAMNWAVEPDAGGVIPARAMSIHH